VIDTIGRRGFLSVNLAALSGFVVRIAHGHDRRTFKLLQLHHRLVLLLLTAYVNLDHLAAQLLELSAHRLDNLNYILQQLSALLLDHLHLVRALIDHFDQ
jgi:hypothetical protein